MPQYRYHARRQDGEPKHGTLHAASRSEALAQLREQELVAVELDDIETTEPPPVPASADPAEPVKRLRRARISLTERALFCRQLALSVNAGVPLRESLDSIAMDIENRSLKGILERILVRLNNGDAFSIALEEHRTSFGPLFAALIRAAEEAGSLPETLNHLATYLERSDKLARKIKSIIAYPVFVLSFFVLVSLIMTIFVLPKFQAIFAGQELPALTRYVFGTNAFILHHAIPIAAGIAAVVAVVALYIRTERGGLQADRLKLRIPLIGGIIRKYTVARFCRNLGIMLRGGVPVTTALDICTGVCANREIEAGLHRARAHIMDGESISDSLATQDVFPGLVIRMVRVGESSGRLPDVMEQVSDVYEDQVEGSILIATSLFEPIVICFFGVIILFLVLAIYMPVFTAAAATG